MRRRFALDVIVVVGVWSVATISAMILAPKRPIGQEEVSGHAATPRELDLAELKAALRSAETVLIDVRGERDYRRGHIPGALSFPRSQFDFRVEALRSESGDRMIVAYCSNVSCPDAARVAGRLVKKGFRNVGIYRGGWDEWRMSQGR